ncbi:MAG: crotonase/enoyl-CoA hydratase family protein [Chloroflexi bacterium]|nr:crotonase/enoyl-CoA hydratase family protein [Chloroflexota bacterium]
MAAKEALLVERDGHIVTLTMNRPEVKNALNPEMLCRLADAWDAVDGDDEVRVAILTGAADAFCAGADLDQLVGRSLKGLPPEDDFEKRCRDDPAVIFKGLLRNYRLAKPLVAAVEGPCIAGGTEILQAADIRVAGEGATFGISEVRWGLFPMGGSTVRLRRQIPYTMAMEILLTGDHISAAEAQRIGLIGRVVPNGGALAEARRIAERIAANGPLAVRKVKQAVQETEGLPEKEALEVEFRIGSQVFASEDAREGPRAFKEKRAPQFKGR